LSGCIAICSEYKPSRYWSRFLGLGERENLTKFVLVLDWDWAFWLLPFMFVGWRDVYIRHFAKNRVAAADAKSRCPGRPMSNVRCLMSDGRGPSQNPRQQPRCRWNAPRLAQNKQTRQSFMTKAIRQLARSPTPSGALTDSGGV